INHLHSENRGTQGRIGQVGLVHNLERDGFTVAEKTLRRVLPVDIGLPAAQSEVDRLLDKHGFNIPKSQLAQAIDAHARGNWASANGHFRHSSKGSWRKSLRGSPRRPDSHCAGMRVAPSWRVSVSFGAS